MDYREWASVKEHSNLEVFQQTIAVNRLFACSTKATQHYATMQFQPNDAFLFGPETRGLPADILQLFDPNQLLRVPMQPQSRSLNLSNAVAVILYEAWRQQQFNGGQ